MTTPDTEPTRRRLPRWVLPAAAVLVLLAVLAVWLWWRARPDERLTWAPPDTQGYTWLEVTEAGTIALDDDTDYVLDTPRTLQGPVTLRGGRNVVWVGGHIRVEDEGVGASATGRRGLVVVDGPEAADRVVHLEGLLIDGADLSEGINTNSPRAVVQLQNVRVEGVHYRSVADLEGTDPYPGPNHPDVVQTWGGVRELRIDRLTGSTGYQGLFLKADQNGPTGTIWLRRVDITGQRREGDDGREQASLRLLYFDPRLTGQLRVDSDTVWLNPVANDIFGSGLGVNVHPPVNHSEQAQAAAASGDSSVQWPTTTLADGRRAVLDFGGEHPGRIRAGRPPDGEWVPAGTAGVDYVNTDGYRDGAE